MLFASTTLDQIKAIQTQPKPAVTATSTQSMNNSTGQNELLAMSKNYGLVIFFQSTCPHCHKFLPILRQFADTYHFNILAISTDGGGNPYFPDAVPNQGEVQIYGVKQIPSLFLYDTKHHRSYAVGIGEMTFDQLGSRLIQLDHNIKQGVTS